MLHVVVQVWDKLSTWSVVRLRGRGALQYEMDRCKAETSEHRGISVKAKRKKVGASGDSRPKWAKITKIFLNVETFRWKWLHIWRKTMFLLRKKSQIGGYLGVKISIFLQNGALGDKTQFCKNICGLWVRAKRKKSGSIGWEQENKLKLSKFSKTFATVWWK